MTTSLASIRNTGAVADPVISPADIEDALTVLVPVEGLGQQLTERLTEETGSHEEWPHSYQFWKVAIAKIDAAKTNRGE